MSMQSWEDQQLGTLTRQYPRWDIWFVRPVYGSVSWHARRKGHRIAEINASSPDELAGKIRKAA